MSNSNTSNSQKRKRKSTNKAKVEKLKQQYPGEANGHLVVPFGTGGAINDYLKGSWYRRFIDIYKGDYQSVNDDVAYKDRSEKHDQKKKIATKLIQDFQNIGGKFVDWCEDEQMWKPERDEKKILEKTKQSLRSGAPQRQRLQAQARLHYEAQLEAAVLQATNSYYHQNQLLLQASGMSPLPPGGGFGAVAGSPMVMGRGYPQGMDRAMPRGVLPPAGARHSVAGNANQQAPLTRVDDDPGNANHEAAALTRGDAPCADTGRGDVAPAAARPNFDPAAGKGDSAGQENTAGHACAEPPSPSVAGHENVTEEEQRILAALLEDNDGGE